MGTAAESFQKENLVANANKTGDVVKIDGETA
jgi:hypothetical protein